MGAIGASARPVMAKELRLRHCEMNPDEFLKTANRLALSRASGAAICRSPITLTKFRHLLICAGFVLFGAPSFSRGGDSGLAGNYQPVPSWVYNGWLGSAVDKENLAKELRRYRAAGLGGIIVVPL